VLFPEATGPSMVMMAGNMGSKINN